MNGDVYMSEAVDLVRRLTAPVYDEDWLVRPLRETLEMHADALLTSYMAGGRAAVIEIGNYHPGLAGKPESEVLNATFSFDDARLVIAREHGFKSWAAVEELGDLAPDPGFELAVDAVVGGDAVELGALLAERPELTRARSRFAHQTTLLHYLAANGVELRRQTTPRNAVEIGALLLATGADVHAKAWHYDGWHAVMPLLTSSAHPVGAGVAKPLIDLLLDYGAEQSV